MHQILASEESFDYLMGVGLLQTLGWELTNRYAEYQHVPRNIDDINDELDDPTCSNYPLFEAEPELDVSKVNVEIPSLKPIIHDLLRQHRNLLAKHEWDSGRIEKERYPINFIDEPHQLKAGFFSKEYYMKPNAKKEVRRQIDGMMEHGVISKCRHPQWVSSIFCIPKKTGDVRVVFDYRKLNLITKKIQWPMPNIEELLSEFKDKKYVTSLDMKGGYWHIPILEEHKARTAFIFDGEVYQWNVLPFGPTNAPMFFQRTMRSIFGELDFVVVYIDDISILSDTVEEHADHIRQVFELLNKHNIKLRVDKCIWGVSQTEYLGFIVDKMGIKTKAKYVKKVMDVPEPTTRKELQRYLGLVQYLHRILPHLHLPVTVLSSLTHKDRPKKFKLNDEQRAAFNKLKEMVNSTDYMRHPDLTQQFHVFTDASMLGVGGMLTQWDENSGSYQPVSYCSKVFNQTQKRWHVSEQELYAALYCISKWERILRGRKFVLHTDHKNLQLLFSKAGDFKTGKLFRWAVRLQDFDFDCRYIKGEDNVIADWLSRESALLSDPQYKKVKEFYDLGAMENKTRTKMSNNGGVDILALYANHLVLSSINNGPVQRHCDPYLELETRSAFNFPLSRHRASNPKEEISSDEDDVESVCSEELLRDKASPPPYVPPQQIPSSKRKTSKQPKRGCTDKTKARLKCFYNPDGTEADFRTGSVATEVELVDPAVARHRPLKIRPYKKYQLGSRESFLDEDGEVIMRRTRKVAEERHKIRESERAVFVAQNKEILNAKPSEPSWNKFILDPRCHHPIYDDYEHLIDDYGHSTAKRQQKEGDEHFRRQMLRAKQSDDWFCSVVINFLETGNKSTVLGLTKHLQRFVLSGRFKINNDSILCYSQPDKFAEGEIKETLKKVAPAVYRKSLLKHAHSTVHHGRTKILRLINHDLGFWWPKMRQQIAVYCESCNSCQHIKEGGYKKYKKSMKLKLFSATKPFEQISVDIVGPLPVSESGNRYIVSIIDKFSRYCMLVPVTDVRAISVVKAIDHWITMFGPPKSILSDNGPQFISGIYSDYMKNHQKIKKLYTSTYHPECNGQIERLHRWIKERLRLISYDCGLNFVDGIDDWSDYLGIIAYSYNTTPNRMTTYTPQEIVLGRNDYKIETYHFDPKLPLEYIDYLAKRQQIIHSKARKRQELYDAHRKKSEDRDSEDYVIQMKQKVLWNINASFSGNKKKLGARWVGPYEVTKIWDNETFRIKVIALPYAESGNPMNPMKIPRRRRNIEITGPVTEFHVPRCQIKPYFKSYEERWNGDESPSALALRCLHEEHLKDQHRSNSVQRLDPDHGPFLIPPVEWDEDEMKHFLSLKVDGGRGSRSKDIQHRYQAIMVLKRIYTGCI